MTDGEMEPGSAAALGRILNEAGIYLKMRAQFAEADEMLRQALEVCEADLGPDHPTVVTCVNNLGGVLDDQGDVDGAKERYERALQIWGDTYGPDHPQVAIGVNNLGSVLEDQGDLDGAKECYERALRIDEDTYGPTTQRWQQTSTTWDSCYGVRATWAGRKSASNARYATSSGSLAPNIQTR